MNETFHFLFVGHTLSSVVVSIIFILKDTTKINKNNINTMATPQTDARVQEENGVEPGHSKGMVRILAVFFCLSIAKVIPVSSGDCAATANDLNNNCMYTPKITNRRRK
jgi:hypothetical protein